MNKHGHVLNGILLGVGVGYLLVPGTDMPTVRSIISVAVPVMLGALVPDIDTAFGAHRKTGHNLFVLAVFVAFPIVFSNLRYVWIGVLTHYILDVMGSKRGIALFWPFTNDEYDLEMGVPVSSGYATHVTLLVTAFELGVTGTVLWVLAMTDIPALPAPL